MSAKKKAVKAVIIEGTVASVVVASFGVVGAASKIALEVREYVTKTAKSKDFDMSKIWDETDESKKQRKAIQKDVYAAVKDGKKMDELTAVQKAAYDACAQAFRRLWRSLAPVEPVVEVETTSESSEGEGSDGSESVVTKTEDELYATFTVALNAACSQYLTASNVSDKMEDIAKAAILHLQTSWVK